MAIDKAVDSAVLDAGLISIANAIRAKSGTSAQLNFPDGFTDAVKAIQSAKPEQTKTVDIPSNGTTTVTPDNGNVLSAVTVNVNVSNKTEAEDALLNRSIRTYTNDRLISVGAYAFCFCSDLTDVQMNKVETIGASAFNGCRSLNEANFPSVTAVTTSAFVSCVALKRIELPLVASFGATVFQQCSSLNTLIIRTPNAVCSLASTSSFNGTLIASGTGYIYVPDNLVDQYKAATNWTFYSSQIKPLSELPEVSV